MNGLNDKIIISFFFIVLFICSGCKSDSKISDGNNYPSSQELLALRQKVKNEVLDFSKEQYSRYFILKYSGYSNDILISLKHLKNDTLMIYTLSKEEYKKYLFHETDTVNKPIYYYPFGINQYISKADYSVGNKLLNMIDSITLINKKLKEEVNEEITESDRFSLQYWNGNKFFEMKLNYLNEKSFDFIFSKIPILYENDSSALRLMRESIEGTNN